MDKETLIQRLDERIAAGPQQVSFTDSVREHHYADLATHELLREARAALAAMEAPKVVAAFVAPDTQAWQSRCVNVTSDGAWHTWNYVERKWDADLPPIANYTQPQLQHRRAA